MNEIRETEFELLELVKGNADVTTVSTILGPTRL
jgi:hypothetical protein